jgi:hypothetical protein
VAVFAIGLMLHRLAMVRARSDLGLMIPTSVLLLAPVHTAMAACNIVTLAFALGLGAIVCLAGSRNVAAGVLLVAAAGLKPTIALPFVIYALVSPKRMKLIAPAVLTAVTLFAIALLPPHARTLWWSSFAANNRSMFAPGAIDDFSTANPMSFQVINFQAALFPILQNRFAVQLTTAMIFILVLSIWLWIVSRDGKLGLLDLAILASAALLPVYHRFTDAGMLLVAVTWSLTELRGRSRQYAIACLILLIPFLVPGATMLYELSERNQFLQKLSYAWLWRSLIIPHECWAILAICGVLLAARFKNRDSQKLPAAAATGAVELQLAPKAGGC